MKKVRMGIVRLEAQGSFYAKILSGQPIIPGADPINPSDLLELTAVSNRDPAAFGALHDRPKIRCFTDWHEMITSGACDAVILSVPHQLHSEIAIYAMEHGIHVFCKKPTSVRASDTRAMIACAEKHPELTFAVMFNQRTNTVYTRLHEMITSGQLGEPRRFNWIMNTNWRPDSYYASAKWRGTWKGEGGGLVNTAPRQLDLWMWLCGKPASVYTVAREGFHRDVEVETDATILAEYENGATGIFMACTHDMMGTDRMEIDLSRGKVVVENGSHATMTTFLRLRAGILSNSIAEMKASPLPRLQRIA